MDERIRIFDVFKNPAIYQLMEKIIGQHHPHLADARILLGYHYGYAKKPKKSKKTKPNPYAPKRKMKLATCKLASDLEKSLTTEGVDFVILLNPQYWLAATEKQREALLDHELCHAGEKRNQNGDRTGWRIIPHDLEEFAAVVRRHGLWESDVQAFADACQGKPAAPPGPDLFSETGERAESGEHDEDGPRSPITEAKLSIFNPETGEWVPVGNLPIGNQTGEAAGSCI